MCLLWKFSRKKLFLILNAASYTRCKGRTMFCLYIGARSIQFFLFCLKNQQEL